MKKSENRTKSKRKISAKKKQTEEAFKRNR